LFSRVELTVKVRISCYFCAAHVNEAPIGYICIRSRKTQQSKVADGNVSSKNTLNANLKYFFSILLR